MEIRVNANGDVIINVTNGETDKALEMIHALQADARRKTLSTDRSEVGKQAQTKVSGSNLNAIQYRTWEYLCENDNSGGVHVSQVARAFAVSNAAANSRLSTLYQLGYANRVAKGYYRALTPEGG
jgi:hypothetical protein